MDLYIIMAWVLLCDIAMVYTTYRLAFREGRRAQDMVEARYANALAEVTKVSIQVRDLEFPEIPHIPTVDEIVKALPPVHISEDELGRIRESISGAINGTVGSYMKKAGNAIEETEDVDFGSLITKMILGKLQK